VKIVGFELVDLAFRDVEIENKGGRGTAATSTVVSIG
jgi:hypothetical protein